MKYLFFDLPVHRAILNPEEKPIQQILREAGGNTGNLLFRYAIRSQIGDELVDTHWKEGVALAQTGKFDGVVLAGANWLNTSQPFGNEKRARALRELGLPVICIGLGCQHYFTTHEKLEFPKETLDFLDALRELEACVLVRDEMTLIQCRHYGLKDVHLTGCPSNFINSSDDFADKLISKTERSHYDKVILNSGHFAGPTLELDRKLLPLTKHRPGSYLVQANHNGAIAMALDKSGEYSGKDIRHMRKSFKLGGGFFGRKEAFEEWRSLLGVYLDVEAWLKDASSWDFAIGSRIHGTMAPVQAGTPAVLVATDSRTEGLASLMGVPYIKIEDALKLENPVSVKDLINLSQLDWMSYVEKRKKLAREYASHLNRFGLTLTPSLERIIS
ncbi:polysaccharide pyruvyl transferase family protein [Puniceicoccales bacterium CK1056]|uniref:Polysaccharide pyruvyl transferase family protein n=1 Tax=Oceanipulchritudo coccoides TaxID=2706888 RepID=A0A6B2M040_9BACT|nr:polysaccharide pyruvyl transferase family protein [Oceanipulchritudo coccoides]NDV62321.1 polysaccharide pyruvyl transferase family protein [Oceanipulchritudo coccoides]